MLHSGEEGSDARVRDTRTHGLFGQKEESPRHFSGSRLVFVKSQDAQYLHVGRVGQYGLHAYIVIECLDVVQISEVLFEIDGTAGHTSHAAVRIERPQRLDVGQEQRGDVDYPRGVRSIGLDRESRERRGSLVDLNGRGDVLVSGIDHGTPGRKLLQHDHRILLDKPNMQRLYGLRSHQSIRVVIDLRHGRSEQHIAP